MEVCLLTHIRICIYFPISQKKNFVKIIVGLADADGNKFEKIPISAVWLQFGNELFKSRPHFFRSPAFLKLTSKSLVVGRLPE